jgi:membrane protease YdiL (CAAX protease family)
MPLFALQPPFVVPLAVSTVTTCVVLWLWVVAYRWRRRSLVAYQPRRPAPWHAVDLAAVVLFYMVLLSGLIELAGKLLGPHAMQASGEATTEHVVGRLIAERDVWIFLLSAISAAIVAPISEEFFFRVLLQGWFEALEHRWRRQMPTLRRLMSRGAGPILLTSFLFARLHFHVESPQPGAGFLTFVLVSDMAARLLAIAFAVGWLRWRVGATAADLGWTPGNSRTDIKLGLTGLAAVAVPVYAMQCVLLAVLPKYLAPDPFPLFFFAIALGAIYFRTHRILPVIVLHAAFNSASLVLAWLGS